MKLSTHELEQRYSDFLSEVYGAVKICGLEYDAARALKEIDPTAFRCGFNDWLDAEVTEGLIFELDGEYYDEEPTEESA
jgi:hypothetical protein